MGGRLSVPRGPGGTTEASRVPATTSGRRPAARFNTRTLFVPVAAVALGTIFFVYSRTSIQAAKENARRHREADGGTISWRNEGLRRHSRLEKPQERTLWQQLFVPEDEASVERRKAEARRLDALGRATRGRNPIEEGIRRAKEGRSPGGTDGGEEE